MSNLDDLIICTNPTRRDVKKIYGQERYARGVILKNGDVIVWNGEVMHSKVMPYMPESGLHFSIFKDKLEVCWQFESWQDVQERLKQAKKYFDILDYPEDGEVVMDTMFYTHTKKKFPEIRYKELFEEGYELGPIEE
ncbi:hypothetical protein [Ammoniphilus sp. CFH 90114]|uniref:hypothetical protein n=1 Tax=Ammoniphilus sp. CFH 90114 TaxID=2493665 RepID=UPI00100FA9AF|nr:hypothetical protein [Ammoniphilus sp. CFH 90114]RXT15223.1 hypothetical protein EIZ39_03155 [Ammoniphilus sp. CFH 90114]